MMKKKWSFLTVSGLFIILSSVLVEAGLPEMFAKMGRFFFETLPQMGDFGFKFLLWIALFTLFDFGLKKAHFDNKVAGILSMVLSLGTVIIAPAGFVQQIFTLYWTLIVFILGVVVPLILLMVIHKNFEGDDPLQRVMRGLSYIAVGLSLFFFASWAEGVKVVSAVGFA